MSSYEIEVAINNLINLMEAKLEIIRFHFDEISNQQKLSNVIVSIKKEIEELYVDFEDISDENCNKLYDLKEEYILLFGCYE